MLSPRRPIRIVLLAGALFASSAATAAARQDDQLWVARSGSDAAPGTAKRPVKTLRRALALARPGERVLVRGGTYPELTVAAPRVTARRPIVLQPAPGERPVVTNGFKLDGARHVRIAGMTFDGSTNPQGFGTSIWDSEHVELSGNEITGYRSAQGVLVKEQSTAVRIVGTASTTSACGTATSTASTVSPGAAS